MAMAHDFKISEVAEIAFEMGALYVQDKHNSPITNSKILNNFIPEEAKYIFPNLPRNYSLCFTNGCFDVLHRGHIETLKFAKSKADKLVVAVNTDDSVARLKPGRPINNLANRMAVLASLDCVDYVVSFSEDTPYELIKCLKPDVLVKGEPYFINNIIGAELVNKVYIAPKFEDLSSTKTLKKIEALKN
jgi:D-beta-D-heptose 7-phosphate kinase/D-beta-D-heptose 1-phosphate adenosyltransferase